MTLVTLLYIRNKAGDFLLIERNKEPNKGMLSPLGGKLESEKAELPIDCARREAFEECGLATKRDDWILRGIASEKDYPNAGNMLMFFYELKEHIEKIPFEINEGVFRFVKQDEILSGNIPETDRMFFWERILSESNDPFEIMLDCKGQPEEIGQELY